MRNSQRFHIFAITGTTGNDKTANMFNWLYDPHYNYATAWGITIYFLVVCVLTWAFFPGFFLFACLISTYVSLAGWNWYYSEWIENSLGSQAPEVIGNRAIFVNTRIALFGAASAIAVFAIVGIALNRDVTSSQFLIIASAFAIAVPLSLLSIRLKSILLRFMIEVCQIPFNLAIVWLAITNEESFLDKKYARLNSTATKLFARITGYSSNLSILHHPDYILSNLPKRK